MNSFKYITILFITFLMLFSCKETSSKPKTTEASNSSKTVTNKVENPQIAILKIEGMTCAMGCAKTIEDKLAATEGVQKVTVDFEKKEAVVNYDGADVDVNELYKTIEAAADGKTYKVVNKDSKI